MFLRCCVVAFVLFSLYLQAADGGEEFKALRFHALQELIDNKNLMPHLDNAMARSCIFVCKKWHKNIVAYRDDMIKAFEKAYPSDQKMMIALVKEDGSNVCIFADSVVIDASGNWGYGMSNEEYARSYKYQLTDVTSSAYYVRRFLMHKVRVNHAIVNAKRTLALWKADKDQVTGNELAGFRTLMMGQRQAFSNDRPGLKITLYHVNDSDLRYLAFYEEELQSSCIQGDGMAINNYPSGQQVRKNWYEDWRKQDREKEEQRQSQQKKEVENSAKRDVGIISSIKHFFEKKD